MKSENKEWVERVRSVAAQWRAGERKAAEGAWSVAWAPEGENAVLRLRGDEGDVAVKLRPPSEEQASWTEYEALATRWAAARGLGPEVLLALPEEGLLVTRWLPGALLRTEKLSERGTLERVGRWLRAVHSGPALPWSADLRGDLDAALARVAAELAPDLARSLPRATAQLWSLVELPRSALRPCHNDVHAGNLLDQGPAVQGIDWAVAGMGDPAWDLASLVCGAELGPAAHVALLAAYLDRAPSREELEHARRYALLAEVYYLTWYTSYPSQRPGARERYEARVRAQLPSRRDSAHASLAESPSTF